MLTNLLLFLIMRFAERNTTQRTFMMQLLWKCRFFFEIIKTFLSKLLLKKGLFRNLVPLFRKLLWIRCMIGFGFFTLIFFCMFNTMGVTAEKKTLQTLPPPPSIYVYLFVKWSSFQKVTIYIFLTKKYPSRCLFITKVYFKLTSVGTKIAYILRQRTNLLRLLHYSPIIFLSSVT